MPVEIIPSETKIAIYFFAAVAALLAAAAALRLSIYLNNSFFSIGRSDFH
jgi:hypothetical protein